MKARKDKAAMASSVYPIAGMPVQHERAGYYKKARLL